MSTPQELKAMERDFTLNPRQLRAAGFIPATIYGKGIASQSIQVPGHEFTQVTLHHMMDTPDKQYKLVGMGKELTVRLQQLQIDSVSRAPLSIEFYQAGA